LKQIKENLSLSKTVGPTTAAIGSDLNPGIKHNNPLTTPSLSVTVSTVSTVTPINTTTPLVHNNTTTLVHNNTTTKRSVSDSPAKTVRVSTNSVPLQMLFRRDKLNIITQPSNTTNTTHTNSQVSNTTSPCLPVTLIGRLLSKWVLLQKNTSLLLL